VDLFEHGFNRQRLEDFPAITYMVRWLKKHQPVAARVSVIHGDFRLGNFMWDDNGIVAMLDWEQCHVGDPLEEIAFMYWPLSQRQYMKRSPRGIADMALLPVEHGDDPCRPT
jgi:aminoglycoside phosphotransferase (APT) family kinase protein